MTCKSNAEEELKRTGLQKKDADDKEKYCKKPINN